jgi:hypothetical protein
MNTVFQDLQDQANPRNGQLLRDGREAVSLLNELRQTRQPFMCEFTADNGFNLTVGIAGEFGCVQHSSNDGMPPYLMAIVTTTARPGQADIEFLVGNTTTPIDGRYRLPFGTVAEIVADFVTTGGRHNQVSWEELDSDGV